MYSEGRKSGEKLEHQRGEEAEDRQGDDQEAVGRPFGGLQSRGVGGGFGQISLENIAVGPQHVYRADDQSPEAQDGGDLNGAEAVAETGETGEEDHEFPREIGEAGEADGSHAR